MRLEVVRRLRFQTYGAPVSCSSSAIGYWFHQWLIDLLIFHSFMVYWRASCELALIPTAGFSHWVYCRGFNEANGEGDLRIFCFISFTPSAYLLLHHIWDAARGECCNISLDLLSHCSCTHSIFPCAGGQGMV